MKKITIFVLGILIIAFSMSFISIKNNIENNIKKVDGKFYCDFEAANNEGNKDTYYQFRSNDNEVWWVLTADEIGEIPNFTDNYTLIFSDNGTTEENKPCDCAPELECECELYDDVFISVSKN